MHVKIHYYYYYKYCEFLIINGEFLFVLLFEWHNTEETLVLCL